MEVDVVVVLLLLVVVVAAVDARPQVSGPWASRRIEVDSERRRKAPAHPCRNNIIIVYAHNSPARKLSFRLLLHYQRVVF